MFLGLKLTNASPVADWLPSDVILAVMIAAFGVAVYRRRRGLLAALTFRQDGRAPVDLVALAFIVLVPIWLATKFAYFTGEPRYIEPLSPLLAIGLAGLVGATRGRRAIAAGLILVAITGALTGLSFDRVIATGGAGAVVAGTRIRTGCLPYVVDVLRAERSHGVYANYWIAYTLQFVAGDAV
jgi:hypothetical protein